MSIRQTGMGIQVKMFGGSVLNSGAQLYEPQHIPMQSKPLRVADPRSENELRHCPTGVSVLICGGTRIVPIRSALTAKPALKSGDSLVARLRRANRRQIRGATAFGRAASWDQPPLRGYGAARNSRSGSADCLGTWTAQTCLRFDSTRHVASKKAASCRRTPYSQARLESKISIIRRARRPLLSGIS